MVLFFIFLNQEILERRPLSEEYCVTVKKSKKTRRKETLLQWLNLSMSNVNLLSLRIFAKYEAKESLK